LYFAMARSDDTEITLGTGKMVGIFFGLVALCAVFFALGFKLGKSYVVPSSATPTASAPSGVVRPSAAKSNMTAPPTVDSKATATPTPVGDSPTSEGDLNDSAAGYSVQVAAVSKQEDAEALVGALKKKGYPAVAASTGDKLFHVQVGPFNGIKDAEAVRAKLVSDGYNPILKK
jgi:DedD protein